MTESLVIILGITGLILFGLLIITILILIRVNTLLKANLDTSTEELIRLHQQHESRLKEGFSDTRKELREVSLDNRREQNDGLKSFQDTV